MRNRGTLLLLIFACAFGALYFLYLEPLKKEHQLMEEISKRFFRVKRDSIEFLRIQNASGTFHLVRQGSSWSLSKPTVLEADEKTVERILALITGERIIKIISYDLKRLGEFGLDSPQAVLYIGYNGKIDELVLGKSNPAKTAIYAFAKGISAIFIVEKKIADIRTIGLYELRSKSLFKFDPETVVRIRIAKNSGDVELEKNSGWIMSKPLSGRASDDDIREFLLEILNQRADQFYDGGVPESVLNRDKIKIVLNHADRSETEIMLYYLGTGVNEGSLAFQQGMKYTGRLSRDFWIFVNSDPARFRYRNLFDFREDELSRIMVEKEDNSYELNKKDDKWFVDSSPAGKDRVIDFIWFLKSWKAYKLLVADISFSRDKPNAKISLFDKSSKPIGNITIYDRIKGESLGFMEGEEQFLHYAVSENLPEVCGISSIDLKKIPDAKDIME